MPKEDTQFKPGKPGGPGRPKEPAELHMMKIMTKGEIVVLLNKILQTKPEDLNKFRGTVLEVWLASGVSHAIKTGDFSRLTFIFDRLYGKVPDKVELSEAEKLQTLPDEDLLLEAERAVELFKQKLLTKGG